MNGLAVVFPGQGSQSLGMLADIAAEFSEVEQTFAQASALLGYDLWQLTQHGPADVLNQTVHTQPALLAASYALWQILSSRNALHPIMLAGHSLGEYTALVCAKSLSFNDAIKLVAARGQYMQEAVIAGSGAMAALVGLEVEQVISICEEAIQGSDDILSPANFNSPGQVVIAGHTAAVERALLLAKAQGAKMAVLIPVSVPSHCPLMQPAAERLANVLASVSIQPTTIPVMNNVDAVCYGQPSTIREGLVRQLSSPVRWVDIVQNMVKAGVTQIIECGPGKVLTGLNKRIASNLILKTTMDIKNLHALLKVEDEKRSA